MNKTELLQKLQDIEWDDFEVKDAAFANFAGGWIIFGNRRRVVECQA